LKQNHYTLTWAGRRRRFDSTGTDGYGNARFSNHDHRAAFNHLIQGFGADMMKKAEPVRYLLTHTVQLSVPLSVDIRLVERYGE